MLATHPRYPADQPRPSRVPASRASRVVAGIALAVSMSVLLTAAWLRPSTEGYGTHEQLGLKACGLLEGTGLPCATCGMTTAFAHAADGDLLAAFATQPAGAALALATAAAAVAGAYVLLSGTTIEPLLAWVWRPRTVLIGGAFFLAAWVYKILIVRGVA